MLLKRMLMNSLVSSWQGKWDSGILGEYLSFWELATFCRLVAARRWVFHAVPSVQKSGITIELKGRQVQDKHLRSVANMRLLHVLDLTACPVTDSGLAVLVNLPTLESLILRETRITAKGLSILKQIPNLKTLDVDGTQVDDSDLREHGLLGKKVSVSDVERDANTERTAASDDLVPEMIEIVELNRRLAVLRPETCLPDLAISLNNLGWSRSSPAGISALRESVSINRQLVEQDGKRYLPSLFHALSNLSGALEKQGANDEAFEVLGETIELSRNIPSAGSGIDLALNFQRYSELASHLARQDEAIAAAREAVEIFRETAGGSPDASMLRAWFVQSLDNLGLRFLEAGRHDEALAALDEALQIARARDELRIGTRDLISVLKNRAAVLDALGRHAEADEATQEADNISSSLPKR